VRVLGLGAALVTVAVGWLAGPVAADAPTQVGWWSRLNPGLPVPVPVPVVPDGGLYVANDPSGPTAISALRYAAADGTPGTLTLQFAGSPVGTPAIVACRVTSAWAPAAGGPMSQAPSYDCAEAVPGRVAADGTAVTWELPGSFATLGATEVALVPAPDAGPFQAPFAKPSATSFVPGAAPASPAESPGPVAESEGAASFEPAPDAGAPLELPASGGTFDLPPPPSPPAPATAVGTPAARGGQVALPAVPRVATPAGSGRSDQALGFALLASLAAALWMLADRPARAPRPIGGVRAAGTGAQRHAGATARGSRSRAGSDARVRIGGIGRFARPRTTLPHRL
jgi:hypothetical protein